MIISRSIHIAACGIVLLFFMAEERFVCTTPSLRTHLLGDIWVSPCLGCCEQHCCALTCWGTFGCLRVSAVVSSATVRSPVGGHLGVPVSWLLWAALLWMLGRLYLFELRFSLGLCPGVGLLGHILTLFLVFLWNFHTVFHNGCTNLHSH